MALKITKTYAVGAIVLLLVAGFYLGWFNNYLNPSIIDPVCLSIGGSNVGMCCYDINQTLMPCKQPTAKAVFQGTPGVYYVRPFVKATNLGVTNKIDARLVSVTSSPTNEFGQVFVNNTPTLINQHYTMDIAGQPGAQQVWIPATSNLLYIGNLNGTYTITASVCGRALMPDGVTIDPNQPEQCNSGAGSFIITKEYISFSVGISS